MIKPLGFSLDDKQLKRAGLDYHEYADLKIYENWADFKTAMVGRRLFAITTKGSQNYAKVNFEQDDVFIFGPETRGLPKEIRSEFASNKKLRLPMLADSRSLNLSNSAAVLLYEAWRQVDFKGSV